jgi:hypothetical protein
MKFNLWFVVLLALMPVFLLFAGLSAAGGFLSSAEWQVIGLAAAAGLVASVLANRRADADPATSPKPSDSSGDASKDDSAAADTAGTTGYSSPPCFLHELDPASLGYLTREEVLALLDELLEAERAGAFDAGRMSEQAAGARSRSTLRGIAGDEARFCAMLSSHITRLAVAPGRETGGFHAKPAAVGLDDRLKLLNSGQGWVVHRLRESLPAIADEPLRADLREMLEVHQRNLEQCARLGQSTEAMAVE